MTLYEKPKQQILVNDVAIGTEVISTAVTQRENGVWDAFLFTNDELGKSFLSALQLQDNVEIQQMYADKEGDDWHTVFKGKVDSLNPNLNIGGETCGVHCVGEGICLKQMRVKATYGSQALDLAFYDDLVYVDQWTNEQSDWTKEGASPYLQEGDSEYIWLTCVADNVGKDDYAYKTADIESRETMELSEFNFDLRCRLFGIGSDPVVYVTVDIYDGDGWVYLPPKRVPTSTFDWLEWDVKAALDPTKFNDYKIKITLYSIGTPDEDIQCQISAACFYIKGYGFNGTNPTLRAILTEDKGIIPEYVEKIFGGDSSGYILDDDYVWDMEGEYNYLYFPFESPFDSLRVIIDLANAMNYPDAGPHWIVTPDGKLCIAPVGDHNVDGKTGYTVEDVWATYARADPIEVTKEMIVTDFTKEEPQANYVLVAGNFTFPIREWFTEGHAEEWDKFGGTFTPVNDAETYYIGSFSVKFEITAGVANWFWFPKSYDLAIDVEKIGTRKNVPVIGFWYRGGASPDGFRIKLFEDEDNSFYLDLADQVSTANEWHWIEVPIGPYAYDKQGKSVWQKLGNPHWTNINRIGFWVTLAGIGTNNVWIDGLEINGSVIRAAYHSNNIATYGCKMKVIKDCLASTDSLNEDDDSSLLALVAKGELIRAMYPLFSGRIVIPLDATIMAGQLVKIKNPRNANFPHDDEQEYLTMRIVEVQHSFSVAGATTTLTLVDDLKNSVSIGPVDSYTALVRAISPDAQDKTLASLKATKELDPELTVLATDYA